VVGEPTALDRTVSLRGFAVVEVEIMGRAAHSSMPAQGVNAVTHLGRLLTAIELADAALQGGGSLLATVAAGGQAPFSLAASARATLERRTAPEEGSTRRLPTSSRSSISYAKTIPPFSARARLVVGRGEWRLDDAGPAAEFADRLDNGRPGTYRSPVCRAVLDRGAVIRRHRDPGRDLWSLGRRTACRRRVGRPPPGSRVRRGHGYSLPGLRPHLVSLPADPLGLRGRRLCWHVASVGPNSAMCRQLTRCGACRARVGDRQAGGAGGFEEELVIAEQEAHGAAEIQRGRQMDCIESP
jgi:Peptidase dimerisation domain